MERRLFQTFFSLQCFDAVDAESNQNRSIIKRCRLKSVCLSFTFLTRQVLLHGWWATCLLWYVFTRPGVSTFDIKKRKSLRLLIKILQQF